MESLFICLWDPNKRKNISKNSIKNIFKKSQKKISKNKINSIKFISSYRIIKLNVKKKKQKKTNIPQNSFKFKKLK
jgi:hypothetical protein